jgi:hypothetical protein
MPDYNLYQHANYHQWVAQGLFVMGGGEYGTLSPNMRVQLLDYFHNEYPVWQIEWSDVNGPDDNLVLSRDNPDELYQMYFHKTPAGMVVLIDHAIDAESVDFDDATLQQFKNGINQVLNEGLPPQNANGNVVMAGGKRRYRKSRRSRKQKQRRRRQTRSRR